MNEIAQALRQLADRIDEGLMLPGGATVQSAALVCSDNDKVLSATYIGRLVPAPEAGIFLLAGGIQKFMQGKQPSHVGTTVGSTH